MEAIASSSKTKSNKKHIFNAQAYLASVGVARTIVEYRRSEKAYSQGDLATEVMYIQKGDMKLSIVNEVGNEAVVAILGPDNFLGEGCLARQSVRRETAAALTPATVLAIQKNEMIRVLHAEREFADRFITYMLERNSRIEDDFIDQLFNSSEKRLARTLLLLTRYGTQEEPQKMLPNISQEMLAEMIGTTRSRVNFFMTKFRKLGFIGYDGGLHINPSLLNIVLYEEASTFTGCSLEASAKNLRFRYRIGVNKGNKGPLKARL
jgi:CRP/FNR family transcriptional regulator, cyclic AMP receptor protein